MISSFPSFEISCRAVLTPKVRERCILLWRSQKEPRSHDCGKTPSCHTFLGTWWQVLLFRTFYLWKIDELVFGWSEVKSTLGDTLSKHFFFLKYWGQRLPIVALIGLLCSVEFVRLWHPLSKPKSPPSSVLGVRFRKLLLYKCFDCGFDLGSQRARIFRRARPR